MLTVPLPSSHFYRSASVKQSFILFTLCLLTMLLVSYILLYGYFVHNQSTTSELLLEKVIAEVNYKLDRNDENFDDVYYYQNPILAGFRFVVFSPQGKTIIIANGGSSKLDHLPKWNLSQQQTNIITDNIEGLEAWQLLHKDYRLYANIKYTSFLDFIQQKRYYQLPVVIVIIFLLIFLFRLNAHHKAWLQLANYYQAIQQHNAISSYQPLKLHQHFFYSDAEIFQFEQMLNRISFQMHQYHQKLAQARHYQELLIDGSLIPLFLVNRKGQISYFNKCFAMTFDTDFQKDTVYLLTDFIAGQDKTSQQTLLQLKHIHQVTNILVTNLHRTKFFNLLLNPIYNQFGQLQSFSCSLELVNNYYQQLQESWITIKQLQDKLASTDESRAFLAHELRTPLTSIISITDLFERHSLSLKQQEDLDTILQSSKELLDFLNKLLDTAKLEAGKLNVHVVSVELAEFIKRICNLVASKARAQGIDLLCYIDPEVPCYIETDNHFLRQILENLLGNAIKFTKKGYVALVLTIVNKEDPIIQQYLTQKQLTDKWIKFSIQDTGIGINESEQSRLFFRFNQANDNISHKFGGTGLGLVNSKRFSQLLGGFIHLKSEQGKGSDFQVYLPLEVYRSQSIYQFKIEEYPIQLIIITAFEISRQHFYSLSNVLNLPTIIRVGINEEIVQEINHKLMSDLTPIFLIDEICFEKAPKLFNKIHNFNHANKILCSMKPTSDINQEILKQFDNFLQKPLYVSNFIGKIIQIYEKILAANDQSSMVSAQVAYEEFLQQHSSNIETLSNNQEQHEIPNTTQPLISQEIKSILVAEDNETNQIIIKRYLEKMGCQVFIADNGKVAIELLKENREKISLILMDCRMPVMDGLQATQLIRAKQDSIPIIALTANESDEDHKLCVEAGMDWVLSKPINEEKLTFIFKKWMI